MKIIFLFALCFFNTMVFALEDISYVDASTPIAEIKDIHRQAEAWAMCAAAYDATSEVLSESQPGRAKQFSELANGAELAVLISIVWDGLKPDLTPEAFDALWTAAKVAGSELPKTRRTFLLAEAETFFAKLGETVKVCASNLESQQKYIDTWRELAKSGLLQLPSD